MSKRPFGSTVASAAWGRPVSLAVGGLLALGLAPVGTSAPAHAQAAQAAAAEDGGFEEVIVTARRRAENLRDVPVSVSAFTAETLELKGDPDITSLQKSVPNLTLQVARGSSSTLIAFIRGVGQQDPLWGFEPGVGLYVDDVYVARPQGAVLDIYDIERIEVLRGPQGTLYGRNTIGGAVKYVTRKIGDETRGTAKVNVGSYGQRDVIASAGGPVTDKVSVSAAYALYQRDGYGKNLTTGAEHYNRDAQAGRVSLEATPTETLFIRLNAERLDDNSNAKHGHRLIPVAGASNLSNVYDTRGGIGDSNNVETRGLSGTVEWAASDVLTFKSITAYREGETQTVIDFDSLPASTLDVPAVYGDDQFTQEVQAVFDFQRFQGIFGVYYLDASANGAFDTIIGNAALTTFTSGEVDTESLSVFGDVSFDITEQLKASLGGRWTQDEKTGQVYRADFTGLRSPLFGGAQRAPFRIRTNYSRSETFEEFTPRVSLTYAVAETVNVYGSYSKGFKSGGFDMRGDAFLTPNTVNGYDPETVDSYELGVKGNFLNRKLQLNTAFFYSDYKDQQITSQVPAGASIASFVDNAGSSEIWGLEFEGLASLTDNFTAAFALGYINAEFNEFITYDLATQRFINVADRRVFQNTPEWSGNLTLTYVAELADGNGNLTFTGGASYRSDMSMFETPNPLLDQEAYTLLDLSVVWTSGNDMWRVGLHGRNLTDERYRVGGYAFTGALLGESTTGFYGPPRTVTATVELRF